ncbi:hypothetical protein LTR56_024040 [Elasticomyces elasticus]|nr:hypothetical protein LTR56_024040 [Elasticomyces elasticus]KAK4908446.1 hypothetical protein LTR49_022652 [Elasticomyces elasticus]KAK5743187.1 hypothetical protein LTS12_023960 [Elasticomyces elasticus]
MLYFWLPSRLVNSADASQKLFIAFNICYGLFASAYVSLFPTSLVELFGVQNFASVNGFLYMVRGASALVGTPVAGATVRTSGSITGQPHSYEGMAFLVSALLVAASLCTAWVRFEATIAGLEVAAGVLTIIPGLQGVGLALQGGIIIGKAAAWAYKKYEESQQAGAEQESAPQGPPAEKPEASMNGDPQTGGQTIADLPQPEISPDPDPKPGPSSPAQAPAQTAPKGKVNPVNQEKANVIPDKKIEAPVRNDPNLPVG